MADTKRLLSKECTIGLQEVEDVYKRHFPGKGVYRELKGKSDPFFDLSIYPELPREFFAAEMLSQESVKKSWANPKDLLAAAAAVSVLTRILAAYIWKRGELPRVRHVLDGLLKSKAIPNDLVRSETSSSSATPVDRDVMRQFGRHLADRDAEPICDQHTFRAFKILTNHAEQASESTLTASEVREYVKWWSKTLPKRKLPADEAQRHATLYRLDQLLFSLGKAALLHSKKQSAPPKST